MAYQPDLERLLTVGSRYADDHAEYVIERHRLADVVLPTGRGDLLCHRFLRGTARG